MSNELANNRIEIALPTGTVHRIGLEIPPNLKPEEFAEHVLGPLKEMSEKLADSSLWWWGDALAYQEQNYGTKYDDAIIQSGYGYGTLANAVTVCKRIEFSRRRENLSFSHHFDIAVAFEDPAEQDNWLDKAEREQLSRKNLRLAIRAAKAEYKGENEQSDTAEILRPVTAFKKTLIWFEGQNISQWSQAQKEAWRSDLRRFVELVAPLMED